MFRWLSFFALAAVALQTAAQSLPPIYDKTPKAIRQATVLAEFPPQTFLENIALDKSGNMVINSHLDGKVYKVDQTGKKVQWSTVNGKIAGLLVNQDGSAFVSGWVKGSEPAVFAIDASGKSEVFAKLEQDMFPNGMLRLNAKDILVVDSYKGVIWRIDTKTKQVSTWLKNALLERGDSNNPTPAVNGIKSYHGDVYLSNTAKQTLLKVTVQKGEAKSITVVMDQIGLDDFDFDHQGTLYGATHVYNSLVSVAQNGKVTVIAGLEEGMAGSTAVATRVNGKKTSVFVATNGGMSLPPAGGVQTAKVVKLDVSE